MDRFPPSTDMIDSELDLLSRMLFGY
jgi:hypothetical protein